MSRLQAFALLSLAGITACVSSPSGEGGGAVGVARASIAVVPPSVDCVRITATTKQTKTYNFDVVPGQGSVLTMDNVPVGTVTFAAFAYQSSCAAIGASQPTWASATTTAAILPGQTAQVGLTLSQVGSATATIDFNTDGGVSDMAVAVDVASACLPTNAGCTSNSQCCSGACVILLNVCQ